MPEKTTSGAALSVFADAVQTKFKRLGRGEPEDQLRGPFESFMEALGRHLSLKVSCIGEVRLDNRVGKPDFGINVNGLLAGYVELKAPGVGADVKKYTGHNLAQWKRFQSIPNILYCDGNEWSLYRSGERIGKVVRLSGDIATEGKSAVVTANSSEIERLLRDFFSWEPIIPKDRKSKIDLKGFAELLAPLCRMLRDDVTEALSDQDSPLVQLAQDWRQLLFPDANNEQFADAYAQTVAFALLLGRGEGANPLSLETAERSLSAQHSLLSRALEILTDPKVQAEMSASLSLLIRVIGQVPVSTMSGPEDPWLYFYEDFLAIYDPKLRKDAGAYYTPIEVVRSQVRLIEDLLINRLGKRDGFVDSSVVTIDPAAGTGTYLLGIVDHALRKVEKEQGKGAVAGQATALAANLYGFEIMVGPYAVSELRVSRALKDKGATLPADGSGVFLTDTLESPHAVPPQLPMYLRPISDQHSKALKVKSKVPVIVCLGNPPYDRHEAAGGDNKAKTGNWVRWGDDEKGKGSILRDFLDPAIAAGHGGDVKNLYNLYVYFWRWALWKVFEHKTATGPGIVSYISASSYLDGDAFCGMREHMRRICDEIWILDLGGEGRGTRKTENVFAIKTPVAIAVAVRAGKATKSRPATVHYARIEGTRDAKLATLDSITGFASINWQKCPEVWHAPFRPAGKGVYFDWPLLTDLMPWQHSGVQLKRTWPIAPDKDTLGRRWRELLCSKDRSVAFHGTGDREIHGKYKVTLGGKGDSTPIAKLSKNSPMPQTVRYAYRSFDRQMIIADGRLMSRPRPDLWNTLGEHQVFLSGLLTKPLGNGPTLVATADIVDLDHFSGRGAKDIVPLYRDSEGKHSNAVGGLLELLSVKGKLRVEPKDLVSYIYGSVAHPGFTVRFESELESRTLRIPITRDSKLFVKVRDVGAHLLWLHTYGERFIPKGHKKGHIPQGKAKCEVAVPGTPNGYPESFEYNEVTQSLHVGDGVFRPVQPEVFEFEVSGLKVVQSWLRYRMKRGAGKKSSPLDDIRPERWTGQFTTELLELLWVLEATLECYPEQARLLEAIVNGPCFRADELSPVPDEMRKPPSAKSTNHDLFEVDE